jgi:hypothetical protein
MRAPTPRGLRAGRRRHSYASSDVAGALLSQRSPAAYTADEQPFLGGTPDEFVLVQGRCGPRPDRPGHGAAFDFRESMAVSAWTARQARIRVQRAPVKLREMVRLFQPSAACGTCRLQAGCSPRAAMAATSMEPAAVTGSMTGMPSRRLRTSAMPMLVRPVLASTMTSAPASTSV